MLLIDLINQALFSDLISQDFNYSGLIANAEKGGLSQFLAFPF